MRIRVTGLSQGTHQQFQQEPAGSLGFIEEKIHFTEPVRVHFTLQKVGDQIVCRALVNTSMETECSRCLEPAEVKISEEMTLLLVFSGMSARDVTGAELKIIPQDAEEVDVTEEIRQAILLAIPPKPLCKTDCLGLCPQCGINLNLSNCRCQVKVEDARWSGLHKLLSNKSKGE